MTGHLEEDNLEANDLKDLAQILLSPIPGGGVFAMAPFSSLERLFMYILTIEELRLKQ